MLFFKHKISRLLSAPKYIDIWMLFSIIIPVLEILLHTVEDHYIRLEAAEGGMAERQPARKQQQQLLTLNTKTIKILPLGPEQEDEDEEEGRKLTQWVLKRIEVSVGYADCCQSLSLKFIGNVVILIIMAVFISVYWCIGIFKFSNHEQTI